MFGAGHLVHQVRVLLGVGRVLVFGQEGLALRHHLRQFTRRLLQLDHRAGGAWPLELDDVFRRRQRHAAVGHQPRHVGRVMRRAAAPGKGGEVIGNLLTVQFNRAQQRRLR
ncbi:hypothetical protein D3C71_1793520 [compost metagenome]